MKKVIVIPYFGTLPNYFQLWLDSCGRNSEFTWLLLIDCTLDKYTLSDNIIAQKSTLSEIKDIFQVTIRREISLNKPYKLCDFRPIYWMILDYYKIDYDFWGHCDTDMIFGRLSHFLSDDLFEKYDKLYAFGHLSLMSNSPFSKHAFLFDGAKSKWEKAFFDSNNYGFDEIEAIRIWQKQKFLFYRKDTEILDINPQFKSFSLTNLPLNRKRQMFYIINGKVMQGYWNLRGEFKSKEYAYIHFQKRPMRINNNVSAYPIMIINYYGFTGVTALPDSYEQYAEMFPEKEAKDMKYCIKRIQSFVRFYKNKIKKILQ